jgi:hypothetical protein
MLSKGYEGELHSMVRFESHGKDFVKAGLVVVVAVTVLTVDLLRLFTPAIKGWY